MLPFELCHFVLPFELCHFVLQFLLLFHFVSQKHTFLSELVSFKIVTAGFADMLVVWGIVT